MMVSQEWLDRYFDRHVERSGGYWVPASNPVLADRIRSYLRMGLDRLNHLPPEDPFWKNTNREPTLYKLSEYFGARIQSHPQDEEARWIVAAKLLHNGQDNALGWVLEPLMERDFSNIEWVMAAGHWCRMNWGFSHTSTMRDLLTRLRSELPQLKGKLDSLRMTATAHGRQMIDELYRLDSTEWKAALEPLSDSSGI